MFGCKRNRKCKLFPPIIFVELLENAKTSCIKYKLDYYFINIVAAQVHITRFQVLNNANNDH